MSGATKCRASATLIVYVPLGVSLPWAVRVVMELGGRVKSVNEELRRVVVSAPLPETRRIMNTLINGGVPRGSMSVETIIRCRLVSGWEPPPGFRMVSGGSRTVYLGPCAGRLVMVEIKRGLLLAKVGGKTRSPATRLPGPGGFTLAEPPDDEELRRIVSCLWER